MRIFHRIILLSFLFSFYLSFVGVISGLTAEVEFSPLKATTPYGGAKYSSLIDNVRVSSCVSLGDGCIDRINHVLRDADQFIVSFMYRFNSPTLMRTLTDKYINSQQLGKSMPVVVFLDYNQTYENSFEGSQYYNYVKRLIDTVPTSLVKLGSKAFHQKVTISKKIGEEAIVIIGSANATFEADNMHSEDIVFVQSNKLADFYLEEFEKLLRMQPPQKASALFIPEQTVQVFHEHRVEDGKSNTDLLSRLRKGLSLGDKVTLEGGHVGDVVALALSTGYADMEGSKKCMQVVNDALKAKDNKFLLLFENFVSLDERFQKEEIWQNLTNKTPKFIVLDNNKTNRNGVDLLKVGGNKVSLFTPFTGKKFHHKLIIQYFTKGDPIVYTGSFHLSSSAITGNSETIIGIRSHGLADEYLSSILLNSGLGDLPEVWGAIKFHSLEEMPKKPPSVSKTLSLSKHGSSPKMEETRVLQAARQLSLTCKINMNRYADRLDRIRTEIVGTASDADQQDYIGKFFDHFIREFNEGSGSDKLRAIRGLKEKIFEDKQIHNIWSSFLQQLRSEIKKKHTDIDKLPEYSKGAISKWLEDFNIWVEDVKKEEKEKKLGIKNDIDLIEHLLRALNDLYSYEYSFGTLEILEDKLSEILK